ncbi:MAG: purine-nucleoside phosphorylase [Vampirovibrionales bacterium]|nr:purine-nucleoside phosphorylase [Vampirovibrionales bacterium]
MTHPIDFQTQLKASVELIKSRFDKPLDIALVLGSGLGAYADRLENPTVIPYGEIPHFHPSAVEGHAGNLVLGDLKDADGKTLKVGCLQGRFHYYEGHEMAAVTFPIRVLAALGAKTLLVTNAAGGVNATYKPGTLMLISDHLNLTGQNPLRGANAVGIDGKPLGARFSDMTHAYDQTLRQHLKTIAQAEGIVLEEGIYAGLSGPSYETPAEIRMLRTLGADAVGMSTVAEVIVARHMGMRVAGVSCITNAGAGITGEALSHAEVTETAERVKADFTRLLHGFLTKGFLATMPHD